jgi:hypothetical protein
MGALEKVIQLKNAGWGDDQIINNLQQQGISPNEINNALSQAEIKNAVSGDEMELPTPNQNYSQQRMPMTREMQEPQGEYNQEVPQQEYGQEEYYPQENYQQGYSGESFDADTIIEIAEQVIENKTKKIENHIEELNEFKTLTKTKVDNIDERLKKIESMIDKLQITILEKIGSYGQNIGEIKKEMSMMQDSFGKMINNVADKNSLTIKKISKKNI